MLIEFHCTFPISYSSNTLFISIIIVVFDEVLTMSSPVSSKDFFCSLPRDQSRDMGAWEFLLFSRVLHVAFLHLLAEYYCNDCVVIDVLRPFGLYTLGGRKGSALVWHTHGRAFESRLVQQVLRFVGHVNTVQYVELRGTAHECATINWIYRL